LAHRVQFEQWVPAPIEQVFLFFANPANLPRIMPPRTRTELVRLKLVPPPGIVDKQHAPLAGVGSEIVTSFRLLPFLPFRAEWAAVITEFEWNHHFSDVQRRGPFKSFHHHHELREERQSELNGTVVRDVIEYEVEFGWLGKVAEKLFISGQLQRTFEYRQRALEKLLG
jgi:ligand-binding SRPBCC domain-containing protein